MKIETEQKIKAEAIYITREGEKWELADLKRDKDFPLAFVRAIRMRDGVNVCVHINKLTPVVRVK